METNSQEAKGQNKMAALGCLSIIAMATATGFISTTPDNILFIVLRIIVSLITCLSFAYMGSLELIKVMRKTPGLLLRAFSLIWVYCFGWRNIVGILLVFGGNLVNFAKPSFDSTTGNYIPAQDTNVAITGAIFLSLAGGLTLFSGVRRNIEQFIKGTENSETHPKN
jgi:hypothetical protein